MNPFLFVMNILFSFGDVIVASSNPPGNKPTYAPLSRSLLKLAGFAP